MRQRSRTKAKQEQARIILQTQAQLETEKQKALAEVKGEIAGMVVTATEAILQEKINDKKDEELIKQALQKANV